MLEAKSYGYEAPLTSKYGGWRNGIEESLLKQAQEQVVAAGYGPMEWHFREEGAAEIAKELFKRFPNISVIYDPMPENRTLLGEQR